MQLSVMAYHTEDLDKWIASQHYLGYTPAGAILRLGVLEKGIKVIGAMMWGRPEARNLNQEKILELTRMVFVNDTEPFVESHALALARKYIRKHFPKVKLVLAYSDPANGHSGIIYKADNWCDVNTTSGGKWTSSSKPDRRNKSTSRKVRWERSP